MQLRGGDGGIVLADQGVEVGHGLLLGHVAVAVFRQLFCRLSLMTWS